VPEVSGPAFDPRCLIDDAVDVAAWLETVATWGASLLRETWDAWVGAVARLRLDDDEIRRILLPRMAANRRGGGRGTSLECRTLAWQSAGGRTGPL
jgi:hypothetical protein